MTAGQTIDYEALTQEAMRGLVRTVLVRAAKSGLPGDHHFYISFDTQATGVSLSKRLKEKYPREMTIVLQHRFWDLAVSDERFEVKLSFDGIPERLIVPFAAIKVFFDPSVRYGLQFEDPDLGPDAAAPGQLLDAGSRPTRPTAVRKSRAPRKPRSDRESPAADGTERGTSALSARSPAAQPVGAANGSGAEKPLRLEPVAAKPASEAASGDKPQAAPGAQIVSLDSFRKK